MHDIARGAAIQTGCEFEFEPIQNGVNEFIKSPLLDQLFEHYATELGEEVSHDDFGYGSTDTGMSVMSCQRYIHTSKLGQEV